MFSDSGAPTPGEQRSFKHHTPHFIPWLRNSLKPHHASDLGLNGPYKSSPEGPNHLAPLERAKGIGLFSIQGKEKKKGELRLNGVGMARILPVVLRGHHILPGGPGKQKEGRHSKWSQPPEPAPGELPQVPSNNSAPGQDRDSLPRTQGEGTGTSAANYGPLGAPLPAARREDLDRKVADEEDAKAKVWDYASADARCQRQLHSSSWVGSERRGVTERRCGFASSFSYIQQKSRKSQSQRDLREPPVEGFHRPLNGVVFPTGVTGRRLGCAATLRGTRKPRTSSEYAGTPGPNPTQVRGRPTADGELLGKEVGCSRKVVRNQIKRVVGNLEQVLRALRDVHQEMKEVVQQIDILTSSIDLSDDDELRNPPGGGDGADSPVSGSSGDAPGPEDSPGRRDHHRRSVSPWLAFSPEGLSGLRFASTPPRFEDEAGFGPSPQKIPPVRPPTPGLSPLTVNLHHPGSPGSRPPSPGPSTSITVSPSSPLSPKIKPPPTLCPSVIIENKIRHYQNPQSDPPSVGQPSSPWIQPPSACCPPTNMETRISASDHKEEPQSPAPPTNGFSQGRAGPLSALGRRGRKPPPYPHHRLSEQAKREEPRQAPPYPEKRRLLSTTV